ncbi:uncharacterized protein LOC110461612 [Mizuhopecten yessoensis]|uniref:Toll-like receptor 1 n=1 Tax=Mizuhopecten yessoensis TaxID=6573 RepID=A0A210Q012_MIZYE|nr:uncharacterized protein LOC110461612 [Mizuhopecten yessoensis]XP_021370828.1 uncharacterized protein LOC110461612 [Mizuhopecten yessoensis]XP_021370829.1 uncharacterized protein LOC110461612 [Mizuhopecten yessoensis]OWF42066.1 Toll-like receptor 1 [Mizuhopecten yessoensis]
MLEEAVPLLADENEATEHRDSIDEIQSRYLSADNEYHVFISYSSNDADFVEQLRRHLEEDLKFKSMLDAHFTPGKSVIDNMSNSYDKCEKVLFVVSEHFLGSGFCEEEVNLAYQYAMEKKRRDYIVVLKIDESQLDRKLRTYTYIDGVDRDIDKIGRKFQMAYARCGSAAVDEENSNGTTILVKYPVEESPNLFGGMNYVFPDLSEDEMEKLRSSDIEHSATCYKAIQTEINRTRLLNRYSMVDGCTVMKKRCVFCGMFTGCLAFLCSILAITYWANGFLRSHWFWFAGVVVVLVLSLSCSAGIAIIWTQRILKKICDGLRSIANTNMNLKSNKYILLSRKDFNGFHLMFIYYDIAPCWEFFKGHVEWSDTSQEYTNKMCRWIFTQAIVLYYGGQHNNITVTNNPRHPMGTFHSCLCQLLDITRTEINESERLKAKTLKSHTEDEETCVMKIVGSEPADNVSCAEETVEI